MKNSLEVDRKGRDESGLIVVKRDGTTVDYDVVKIWSAIKKAFYEAKPFYKSGDAISESITWRITEKVEDEIFEDEFGEIEVEEIQEIIKDILIETPNCSSVAKAYIEYATMRKTLRDSEMDLISRINRLVSGDKEITNENANKDSRTFPTKRDLTSGQVAKVVGLNMLPKDVREAHLRGDIHYHDLDYSPHFEYTNCSLPDIEEMQTNGFNMGNAVIDTPNSIETAVAQITQIIANVASSQYGGTSINRIDEKLEKYAEINYNKHMADTVAFNIPNAEYYAYEKTLVDINRAMQSLEYEINTLYTSNGQTPFTTIGFGLSESRFGREIQKAILNVRIGGLGVDKKTAIFPKLIFFIKDGLNLHKGEPNYDIKQLALKCSSQRMYPDIINSDTLERLTGSVKASMGCRSFLQGWTDPETGKKVDDGRMNLGVVTLNLPRIAIQSNGNKEEFWRIFDERMLVMHNALRSRKERVFETLPEYAPLLYKYGAFGKRLKDGESVAEKLFLNQRSTISLGYIGLYEVGTVFYGSEWETNPEAKEFTLEILKRMKALALQWSDEEGVWYSTYGTPSESLTDRFCKMDKAKFGSIPDITEKDYYTNSFHYDVRKNPNPFEKIDFEKDYPVYASGGFIHYVEYPNIKHNIKALEDVWDYSYDKIGYFGTNTPIDKCYECGSELEFVPTEEGFECSVCGNHNPEKCDVVKRTCGYLGNPLARPMIHGRHEEIASRVKHI